MSKEFTCNRGKNERNGPCKVRLYYDPQVLSQHGRQMPLEVDTGKPHNCSFGRGVLDHPDIVKDCEKAWQYWEEKDVEKLRNEFEKWKNEMVKAKFPYASKEALEKWTLESGKSNRICIRAGLFESKSSRGIKLLLRKSAKNPDSLKDPLLKSYFIGKSSKEGIKEFEEGIFSEEKAAYGDCRTNAEDLYQSHLTLFESQNSLFVNVCGKKIWISKEAQLLKDYL